MSSGNPIKGVESVTDIGDAFARGYTRNQNDNPPTPPSGFATPKANGKNLLQQLAEQCQADSDKYFPAYESQHTSPTGRLSHHVLALCGEAGELANLIKKIDRGSLDPNTEGVRAALIGEAVDVFIYNMNVFAELGVDPLAAYLKKRDFNHGRFIK